jgi:regulator of protease activity HflC (stomatin/prohibitin superfamily)
MLNLKLRHYIAIGITIMCIIFGILLGGQLVSTVERGTYQVKQAAVTGTMTAHLEPGMYGQWFGDIITFPNAETFYFTLDSSEGMKHDQSITVRFVDGSTCKISGTVRIVYPQTEQNAVDLVVKNGFKSKLDMEHKLILPTLRNVLRQTANMMTARESYAEKRADFVAWSWDQLENGAYVTMNEKREIVDPISGEKTIQAFKVIKRDDQGKPIYHTNPLLCGVTLQNFEIKSFEYSKKVQQQIATQQEALMNVATAIAKSKQAEQEKVKAKAEGEAMVMKSKYEKEMQKVKAVVQAQQEKEVAELHAEKNKQVSKLDADAAAFERTANILRGEGEAQRKRAVLAADGALDQKLKAWQNAQQFWANAYATRKVPQMYLSGGGGGKGPDQASLNMNTMMSVWLANQIGLDLTMKKGAKTAK